jgi:response regulator RpfG family c-di-GMP phosphodiesterase
MLYTAILVDDDSITNFINETLIAESARFEPLIIFPNPKEAFEYINKNCFELKTHSLANLLLVDINMPTIDGFELINDLKAVCPDIFDQTIVCLLTTSHHKRDSDKAKELGIEHFVKKPLTKEDIDNFIALLEQKHN